MGNETERYGPSIRADNVRVRIRSRDSSVEPGEERTAGGVRRFSVAPIAATVLGGSGNPPFSEVTFRANAGYPASYPVVTFVQKWARRYAFAADGFAGGLPR